MNQGLVFGHYNSSICTSLDSASSLILCHSISSCSLLKPVKRPTANRDFFNICSERSRSSREMSSLPSICIFQFFSSFHTFLYLPILSLRRCSSSSFGAGASVFAAICALIILIYSVISFSPYLFSLQTAS